MTKILNFENSRWRTAAILKIVLSLYLSRKSSDFNEIWCANTNVDSKNGHMTKCRNFANSKWLTAAILKIVISYIWTIYCPINAKFDMKKQNHTQTQVTLPKYQTEFLFVSGYMSAYRSGGCSELIGDAFLSWLFSRFYQRSVPSRNS